MISVRATPADWRRTASVQPPLANKFIPDAFTPFTDCHRSNVYVPLVPPTLISSTLQSKVSDGRRCNAWAFQVLCTESVEPLVGLVQARQDVL
jgi:hypothetical protein